MKKTYVSAGWAARCGDTPHTIPVVQFSTEELQEFLSNERTLKGTIRVIAEDYRKLTRDLEADAGPGRK